MSLYPNHKPVGIKRDWDQTSITRQDAGIVMRRHGVHAEYGDPVDAVAWFEDQSGLLRCLVADYANGRRATLRKRATGSSLFVGTPEDAA